jgi:hypothetical protein
VTWLKIVPNASPNDEGRWIETNRALPQRFPLTLNYQETVAALGDELPKDHHIVAIAKDLTL